MSTYNFVVEDLMNNEDLDRINDYFNNQEKTLITNFCKNNFIFDENDSDHENSFLVDAMESYFQNIDDIFLSSQNPDI